MVCYLINTEFTSHLTPCTTVHQIIPHINKSHHAKIIAHLITNISQKLITSHFSITWYQYTSQLKQIQIWIQYIISCYSKQKTQTPSPIQNPPQESPHKTPNTNTKSNINQQITPNKQQKPNINNITPHHHTSQNNVSEIKHFLQSFPTSDHIIQFFIDVHYTTNHHFSHHITEK